jgi:hypothetical protein
MVYYNNMSNSDRLLKFWKEDKKPEIKPGTVLNGGFRISREIEDYFEEMGIRITQVGNSVSADGQSVGRLYAVAREMDTDTLKFLRDGFVIDNGRFALESYTVDRGYDMYRLGSYTTPSIDLSPEVIELEFSFYISR